ncbi:alpha/beta fold hydrolase [Streptomyces sp. NPDC093510]|uniref:alpha/beta fold hydrolase n=1 Tax=Streptomyces sp. NPDC093510 TaxID=3155199 RepID=UPI00343DA856
MTTIVLVHGAWTGSYVWHGVRALLRADGHEVFTPTLTGLGERVHLARPDTDLDTHVQDVGNLLRFEDLKDVVLAGHSYGGVVAQLAADRSPRRVAHLVLLDSLLARDGHCVQDLRRHPAPSGTRGIAPPRFRDVDPARLARLLPAVRLSLQPPRTFLQPMALSAPVEERPFHRTYVRAARRSPSAPYEEAAAFTREHPAWHCTDVDSGHDMMTDRPRDVADVLGATPGQAARLSCRRAR